MPFLTLSVVLNRLRKINIPYTVYQQFGTFWESRKPHKLIPFWRSLQLLFWKCWQEPSHEHCNQMQKRRNMMQQLSALRNAALTKVGILCRSRDGTKKCSWRPAIVVVVVDRQGWHNNYQELLQVLNWKIIKTHNIFYCGTSLDAGFSCQSNPKCVAFFFCLFVFLRLFVLFRLKLGVCCFLYYKVLIICLIWVH